MYMVFVPCDHLRILFLRCRILVNDRLNLRKKKQERVRRENAKLFTRLVRIVGALCQYVKCTTVNITRAPGK